MTPNSDLNHNNTVINVYAESSHQLLFTHKLHWCPRTAVIISDGIMLADDKNDTHLDLGPSKGCLSVKTWF